MVVRFQDEVTKPEVRDRTAVREGVEAEGPGSRWRGRGRGGSPKPVRGYGVG